MSTRLTAIALFALIPISALIVVQNLSDRDTRRDAGLREARVFAQEMARSMESFSAQIASFTEAAAIVIADVRNISQESVGPYLSSLTQRYAQISGILITDPQGSLLASASESFQLEPGFDLSDRPYVGALQEAIQAGREYIWVPAVQGLQTGAVTASYSRVVSGQGGEPVAFFVVTFRPANLEEFIPPVPDDANLTLLDASGQLVYSSMYPERALEDMSGSLLVQQTLAGEIVDIDGNRTPFDRDDRYGVMLPVESMGWVVGYTRSIPQLNASLNATLAQNLAILAAIMAVVSVALLFIARQLTRPLQLLAQAATDLERGAATFVPLQAHPAPEIGSLEQAFAGMTRAVQERELQLREQADRLSSLEQAGAAIAANLDYEATAQAIVDAGRSLTEAEFAVFQGRDENRELSGFVSLAGLDEKAFKALPEPLLSPAFTRLRPHRVLRLDDITVESRGESVEGSAVRSCMVVPVVAQKQVVGSLMFGHSQPGAFSERHEDLAVGVASWGAIALDNARLYEESRQIQEELRRANIAKDEFLGLISHELRTPVTTIYGGLRLLVSHPDLLEDEQGGEFLETMATEGSRLVRLIEDLLALTRVELGKEMDRAPVYPNTLVREAIVDFLRQRPDREVRTDLASSLPLIEVEPTYFRQVLSNLLSNADKYSPEGSPISVVTSLESDQFKLVVADSGPGVDPDEVGKIFDSFYRSDKTSNIAVGQGLGLTVCRKLVEAQNGRIWAENRQAGGLAVSVIFDAMPVEPEEAESDTEFES